SGNSGGGLPPPIQSNTPLATAPDPGTPGPCSVTTQEYNFGNTPFHPSAFPGNGVELIGEVKSPSNLADFATPTALIVLLHGRHATTYQGSTAFLEWPPTGAHQSIPSYHGYDYLGDVLASQGYIVVSISSNGINAQDNNVNDLGAQARAELIQ